MSTVQHEVSRQPSGSSDIHLPAPQGTVQEGINDKVFIDRYALKDEAGAPV